MDIRNNTFNPTLSNPTTFKGVKDIKLKNLSPEVFTEHSKIIDTFKENPAFKNFFKKHDGIVIFENFFANSREYTRMSIRYNKKNSIRNLLLAKIFGTRKESSYSNFFSLTANDELCSRSADKLIDKIKSIVSIQNIINN